MPYDYFGCSGPFGPRTGGGSGTAVGPGAAAINIIHNKTFIIYNSQFSQIGVFSIHLAGYRYSGGS